MPQINILTKADMLKNFKVLKQELSKDLNKNLDKKFKDKEEEKARLEKEAIKKQMEKAGTDWKKIKDKDLRLSEIEHKLMNIEEFLKASCKQSHEMVDKFNQHVEGNNANFDVLKKIFKGISGK